MLSRLLSENRPVRHARIVNICFVCFIGNWSTLIEICMGPATTRVPPGLWKNHLETIVL